MTGILSLTTYLPLLGVAAILFLKLAGGRDEAKVASASKWIALAATRRPTTAAISGAWAASSGAGCSARTVLAGATKMACFQNSARPSPTK